MNITPFGNSIFFHFNKPERETRYLSETFDLGTKRAYATLGIQELLHFRDDITLQIILGAIFGTLSKKAKTEKLDYLQNIRINEVDVWCIDDGNSICLMRREEY